jgi:hypothetical protein
MSLAQRFSYVIPAAGLVPNLLTGAGIEYIGRASMMDLYVTADAAGDSFGLTQTVAGDQRTMVPVGSPIGVAGVAGAGPKANEDPVFTGWPIPMGAHLILPVQGVAAHTGRALIILNP